MADGVRLDFANLFNALVKRDVAKDCFALLTTDFRGGHPNAHAWRHECVGDFLSKCIIRVFDVTVEELF